jgi:hypothetical protein
MRRSVLSVLPQLLRSSAAVNSPAFQNLSNKLQWRAFADDANLKKTALYDFHVAHGGEESTGVILLACPVHANQIHIMLWITALRQCAMAGELQSND